LTYGELQQRYPTNAPDAPWYAFSDAELEVDLRLAMELRAHSAHTPQSAGSRIIARWIEQELRARAAASSRGRRGG
jgi:hypothetical protein